MSDQSPPPSDDLGPPPRPTDNPAPPTEPPGSFPAPPTEPPVSFPAPPTELPGSFPAGPGGPGWAPAPGPPMGGDPSQAPMSTYPGAVLVSPPGPGRERPWWGPIDIVLTLLVIVGSVVAGLPILVALALAEGVSFFDLGATTLPPSMIVVPTLVQQAIWFGWPFLLSRWKGLGAASDWGWSFKPADLGIGLGVGLIGITAAGLVGAATSWLVGLEDESQAENTGLLTDYQDSPWLWGIVFIAVVGAPVSEEILFRGVLLRAGAKRWGPVIGAAISLLFFVPVHLADGGIAGDGQLISDGQIVLWASIAALGAVLSAAAIMTGRLAAPIVAHVIINAFGVAGALGYLDFLGV